MLRAAVVCGLLACWGLPACYGPDGLPVDGADGSTVDGADGSTVDGADGLPVDGAPPCATPDEGCACAPGQAPTACFPNPPAGSESCLEGTRYCEGGRWSDCRDVHRFAKPEAASVALVDPLAAHPQCSVCRANCYRVVDTLDPSAGALDPSFASGVAYGSSGSGITLAVTGTPPPAVTPPSGSLYVPLGATRTGSAVAGALYHPRDVDLYFLLDRSTSTTLAVQEFASRLQGTTGLVNTDAVCFNNDDTFRNAGISGYARCLIDDPQFGLGMFRDLPFDPYATDTTLATMDAQLQDAQLELAYRHLQNLDPDVDRTVIALGNLGAPESSGDPDLATSLTQALVATADGTGMWFGFDRPEVPASGGCASGLVGYPCFRDGGGTKVVLAVTDAALHNGPQVTPNPPAVPAADFFDYGYGETPPPASLAIRTGTSMVTTAVPATNDAAATAFDLTASGGDARTVLETFTGSTATLGAQLSDAAFETMCNAEPTAADAHFLFTVGGTSGVNESIYLSTEGSSFDTALAVFSVGGPTSTTMVTNTNETFATAAAGGDVSGGVVRFTGSTGGPDMNADYQGSLVTTCGGGSIAPDAVYAFNVTGGSPVNLQVDVDMGVSRPAVAIYDALPSGTEWPYAAGAATAVSGNDDAATAHVLPDPAGAYYSVTGDTSALTARYDASVLGGASCPQDDSAPEAVFRLDLTGTQTVRIDTEGSSFDTVISIHDAPPAVSSGSGYLDCNDDDNAEVSTSAIETTLTTGTHYIVVKGKTAASQGPFVLTVRDTAAVTASEVACGLGDGTGPATTSFTANPGQTYYAVVKGDTPADKGAYTLSFTDGAAASMLLGCDDNGGVGDASEMTVSLDGGADYYAVIKGAGSGEQGEYRLTVGGAPVTNAQFTPATYADTLAALRGQGIQVGTVLACGAGGCPEADEQLTTLTADLPAGAGMGPRARSAVVDPLDVEQGVASVLTELLRADAVSAQVLWTPDANDDGMGNPLFSATSTPVPMPGDLCTGTTATAHTGCEPGSQSSHRVDLTEVGVLGAPPGPQPDGTYLFTLALNETRDGITTAIDQVPLVVGPSGLLLAGAFASGTYDQDTEATGCMTGLRPSWDELEFDADVPPDTAINLYGCTADTGGDLAGCDMAAMGSSGFRRVLTLSAGTGSGTACTLATEASDCPEGFCSAYTNTCIALEGNDCATDADCPGAAPGSCRTGPTVGNDTCAVVARTGSPAAALGSHNLRPFFRSRVELQPSGNGSRSPSLYYWETRYNCLTSE